MNTLKLNKLFTFNRHVAGYLYKTSVQLWAHSEPRRHTCGQPSLLQLVGLQWDPNWLWLHHRCNKESWNHWRDFTLPVQRDHAFSQLSALLQEPQLRSLPVGVHQLLRHVRAAEWLWGLHRHRWTGETHKKIKTTENQMLLKDYVSLSFVNIGYIGYINPTNFSQKALSRDVVFVYILSIFLTLQKVPKKCVTMLEEHQCKNPSLR